METPIALVYPGQGSQYAGMAKLLRDQTLFEEASDTLGFDLKEICTTDTKGVINQTEFTQPALLTVSVGMNRELSPLLKELELQPQVVLGHSVGEYAALVSAGVLSFEEALKAVQIRGRAMAKAVENNPGKMVAILKLDNETVQKACEEASSGEDLVAPANFNSPGQVVISGTTTACDRAVALLKEKDLKFRAMPLKVSAPFHSPLMQPARKELEQFLDTLSFKDSQLGLIANIDAKLYPAGTPGEVFKKNIIDQICGCVQWTASILALPNFKIALEVGPGKVLCGLNKKIHPELHTLTLDQDNIESSLKEVIQ